MVKALSNIMVKLKNIRVVLTGDFNSTETKLLYDTEGPLPLTNAKYTNAAALVSRGPPSKASPPQSLRS
jgi:hypothetical protein